jgi:tetratricopeptide (TPR) repeat protein
MIITNTPTAAALGGVESLERPTIEEHSLERITALESALQHSNDQVEALLDLLHRQATSGMYDHSMLDALIEHLTERGVVEETRLENLWRNRIVDHYNQSDERERLDNRTARALKAFGGENFDLFARLIDTGSDLFLVGNFKRGIRYFEKAMVLDPANAHLAFLIGEHFFRTNKHQLARVYLEKSNSGHPDNYITILMLGVICGDDGDLDEAKKYLTRALRIEKNSFTAHFGLGRILVSEGKLDQAILHLKRALTLRPTPEMHYLVGRTYLDDGRTRIAMRHLRRCIEMDPKFDAALYHLGLIYLTQDNLTMAQEHFRAAYEINPRESRYRIALRTHKAGHLAPLPVFGRATVTNRKVVTSGDGRLAELLRSDLLGATESGEARKGHKR